MLHLELLWTNHIKHQWHQQTNHHEPTCFARPQSRICLVKRSFIWSALTGSYSGSLPKVQVLMVMILYTVYIRMIPHKKADKFLRELRESWLMIVFEKRLINAHLNFCWTIYMCRICLNCFFQMSEIAPQVVFCRFVHCKTHEFICPWNICQSGHECRVLVQVRFDSQN